MKREEIKASYSRRLDFTAENGCPAWHTQRSIEISLCGSEDIEELVDFYRAKANDMMRLRCFVLAEKYLAFSNNLNNLLQEMLDDERAEKIASVVPALADEEPVDISKEGDTND